MRQISSDEGAFGTVQLFLIGDGKGLPRTDGAGPLQAGLTVDKYMNDKQSFADFVKESVANINNDPRLKILDKSVQENIKLTDGAVAGLFIVLMNKFPGRQSLQMKLVARNETDVCWVVTGWLVGSEKSEIATIGSPAMERLLAHMKTFVFDSSKLDSNLISGYYK